MRRRKLVGSAPRLCALQNTIELRQSSLESRVWSRESRKPQDANLMSRDCRLPTRDARLFLIGTPHSYEKRRARSAPDTQRK